MKKAVVRSHGREAAARHRFLQKIIIFAMSITVERGRELPRTPNDYSFRKVWALCNFGGFSFNVDTRQLSAGGNTVKVWYQPEPLGTQAISPVLEVYWKDRIEKCEVRGIDDDMTWQIEIQNVIKHRKRISNRLDRELCETEEKRLKRSKREIRELLKAQAREQRRIEQNERLTQKYTRRLAKLRCTTKP